MMRRGNNEGRPLHVLLLSTYQWPEACGRVLYHAERRRLAPESLIVEAELVPVVVRGGLHVSHDEIRGDGPALPVFKSSATITLPPVLRKYFPGSFKTLSHFSVTS